MATSADAGSLDPPTAAPPDGESFTELARVRGVVIEQILSSATPDQRRYEQAQDEWVLLLDGEARLEVHGRVVQLRPGDWRLLPAGTPHRVLATAQGTRWLAVHIHPAGR